MPWREYCNQPNMSSLTIVFLISKISRFFAHWFVKKIIFFQEKKYIWHSFFKEIEANISINSIQGLQKVILNMMKPAQCGKLCTFHGYEMKVHHLSPKEIFSWNTLTSRINVPIRTLILERFSCQYGPYSGQYDYQFQRIFKPICINIYEFEYFQKIYSNILQIKKKMHFSTFVGTKNNVRLWFLKDYNLT